MRSSLRSELQRMRVTLALILLIFIFFVAVVPAESRWTDDSLVVQTSSGPIRGYERWGARLFLGVPFAQPPVGALRFADPQPPTPWSTVRDATVFGPACIQHCVLPPDVCPLTTSEDCLTLNVYAPPAGVGPVPVMVFFPGGAYVQGGAGMFFYSGIGFANSTNPVVVVTVNYRLGSFGFLATDQASGQFGLLDQRLALEWVRTNIASFGGNPHDVTISGESAGGTSVASHYCSPGSQGLFHRAIIQSNPWSLPMKTLTQAQSEGADFAKKLGCPTSGAEGLACMRAKSAEEVLAAQLKETDIHVLKPLLTVYTWAPLIGTAELADQPLSMILKGTCPGARAGVPVLLGSNGAEGRTFIYAALPSKALPWFEFDAALAALFHFDVLKVSSMYPANFTSDTRPLLSDLTTDYLMACPSRAVARALTTHTFQYVFERGLPWNSVWGPDYAFCNGFPCHGAELVYVFESSYGARTPLTYPPDDRVLAQQMSAYWASFVSTGDANARRAPGSPEWVEWDETQQTVAVFDVPGTTLAHRHRASYCDFWDTMGYF